MACGLCKPVVVKPHEQLTAGMKESRSNSLHRREQPLAAVVAVALQCIQGGSSDMEHTRRKGASRAGPHTPAHPPALMTVPTPST